MIPTDTDLRLAEIRARLTGSAFDATRAYHIIDEWPRIQACGEAFRAHVRDDVAWLLDLVEKQSRENLALRSDPPAAWRDAYKSLARAGLDLLVLAICSSAVAPLSPAP